MSNGTGLVSNFSGMCLE
jgi:hypothetical protein